MIIPECGFRTALSVSCRLTISIAQTSDVSSQYYRRQAVFLFPTFSNISFLTIDTTPHSAVCIPLSRVSIYLTRKWRWLQPSPLRYVMETGKIVAVSEAWNTLMILSFRSLQIIQNFANLSNPRTIPCTLCTTSCEELHNHRWCIYWNHDVSSTCFSCRLFQCANLHYTVCNLNHNHICNHNIIGVYLLFICTYWRWLLWCKDHRRQLLEPWSD